jgi:hypothetical protein
MMRTVCPAIEVEGELGMLSSHYAAVFVKNEKMMIG